LRKTRHAVAGHAHACIGHDRDPVAREACTDTEVERIVGGRQRRVEPIEGLPHGVTHEDRGWIEAEDVAEAVVLALIEFTCDDRHALPESRHRAAEPGDSLGLVPLHELRACDGDRLAGLERREERPQGFGFRSRVLGEEPQRVGVGGRRLEYAFAGTHRFAE
jgi:hypothetical protein